MRDLSPYVCLKAFCSAFTVPVPGVSSASGNRIRREGLPDCSATLQTPLSIAARPFFYCSDAWRFARFRKKNPIRKRLVQQLCKADDATALLIARPL
ncbi:hypothetical protein CEXT_466821 [Caerostris extrusa]|uniref:Uncharacterized protein n=1 Tax=Caerostris extrusa TaxID=172846 RepID=A0AAV4VYG1_CAEEX|nr:hypothetical protein CEXT_466821 [Caerostris extrusa]